MRFYQESIETMDYTKLKMMQNELFCNLFRRVYNSVDYYKGKIDKAGINIKEIRSLDDIDRLPFMTKDDLRSAYPNRLLAVPKNKSVRIQSTSGTTGKRVIAYYTQRDLEIWEECCARAIVAVGGSSEDVCQVSYGYGLFTGGAGLNGGSQRVGCLTLPMSTGNTSRQIQFMIDLKSTILCCTPSYAANLGEYVVKNDLSGKLSLKSGIFGAEPWIDELRNKIEKDLGIDAYDIYGLTEIMGPGVAFECNQKSGMHIQEDHFYAEVVDPVDGHRLQDGEVGELVLTTLTKEAFPLIRYRTHDLCKIYREKCKCGRTHIRMSKPIGRTDDMFIVNGVNIWPSQIESVLMKNGYSSNYNIIIDRINNNDILEVAVETKNQTEGECVKNQEDAILESAIKDITGVKARVSIVRVGEIERSEGKSKHVFDNRKLY